MSIEQQRIPPTHTHTNTHIHQMPTGMGMVLSAPPPLSQAGAELV